MTAAFRLYVLSVLTEPEIQLHGGPQNFCRVTRSPGIWKGTKPLAQHMKTHYTDFVMPTQTHTHSVIRKKKKRIL